MTYLYIVLAAAYVGAFTALARPPQRHAPGEPELSFAHKGLLAAAILVPVGYFGIQVLAAPWYPHYSVLANTASDLGSNLSMRPAVFNTGALLIGLLAIPGSAGLALSLPRLGVGRASTFALALCLASAGLSAVWAGLHPLPSPRHNPGLLSIGMFAAPLIALWAGWRMPPVRAMRIGLALNALAFVALVFVMSGKAHINLSGIGGGVQKLLALASFAPGAVIAALALGHANASARLA